MGTPRNEGEGNKTADRNYREATKDFVESERGQQEIKNAGKVSPREEKDIRRAEEQAKQRAKDHDPAEMSSGDSGPGASESKPGSSRKSRPAH